MNLLGVVPARYASTRFPGKPLALIAGLPMVVRVWHQALQASQLAKVVVATDDDRIAGCAQQHGATVVLTSPAHPTGTDRLGEVASQMPDFDGYVNIQGDEPFIAPEQIDAVCGLIQHPLDIGTLVRPIEEPDLLYNPNVVKVVRASNGDALYFSRSPIPHNRGAEQPAGWLAQGSHWQHVGLYAFGRQALLHAVGLPPGILEQLESLEQLRWLEAGMRIRTQVTHHPSHGVDTPGDVDRVLKLNGLA